MPTGPMWLPTCGLLIEQDRISKQFSSCRVPRFLSSLPTDARMLENPI